MPRALKFALSSLLIGLMSVGLAYAGAILVPTSKTSIASGGTKKASIIADLPAQAEGEQGGGNNHITPAPGTVLAGAAKISLEPKPGPNDVWQHTMEECATLSENGLPPNPDHLAVAGSPWPENPNCIYMGGFGIGPMNPVTTWDTEDYDPSTPQDCVSNAGATNENPDAGFDGCGVWVRSFAVKGPNGKTFTMTIIDSEGYLWDYKNKCDDCGIKQITAELAADPDLGLQADGIIIGATHTHSGPEFLGGWGFVPDWYMEQVHTAITDSVRQAVLSMEPAVLEAGEEMARPYNNERRDTYRSAEEQELTWLRAIGTNGNGSPTPKTIATIGAYAAHPTANGTNDGRASSDWPGAFERRVEDRFGGVGLYFMTGLGNMSNSGGMAIGAKLADLIPGVGDGLRLDKTDVTYNHTEWVHPATNVPLTALGFPGFFDREFVTQPSEVRTGKSPDTAPCESASPVSVEMPANAMRIGDQFALTASPGEIFSNISNTIKEKSDAEITMPLAQTMDALGYMPQSIELSPIGQQGLGFAVSGVLVVNYEDSYSVDRCMGDKVLETAISLLNGLPR
ncbi:MAG: hypothetical protein QOG04_1867 [Actinomycetota bacterium]|jgi:hypothetical protein|nr:hypothetical protein [Actinomycetota bacterium]